MRDMRCCVTVPSTIEFKDALEIQNELEVKWS